MVYCNVTSKTERIRVVSEVEQRRKNFDLKKLGIIA